jgi:hypothetical protein
MSIIVSHSDTAVAWATNSTASRRATNRVVTRMEYNLGLRD